MKRRTEKALVAVAHADDHIIWMGGTILKLRYEWEWDFVCFCLNNNNFKSRTFEASCSMLEVKNWRFFNFADYLKEQPFAYNRKEDMKKRLLHFINESNKKAKYDYIFTHGSEYGHHANHLEVKEIIKELKHQILKKEGNILYFDYKPIYPEKIATVASRNADFYVQLNYLELKQKLELIDYFKFWAGPDLKELAWPCPNPEAFSIENKNYPIPHQIFKQR